MVRTSHAYRTVAPNFHCLASACNRIGGSSYEGTEADQNQAAREIAEALLEAGLPVDAKDQDGLTAFEDAERVVHRSMDWLHKLNERRQRAANLLREN